MEVLYRAQSTASGGGREDGRSATDDGKIDVKLSTPTEMGGKGGDGTNPEQLFATGYAACYLGALRLVSGKAGTPVSPDTKVTAGVGFGKNLKGEGFNWQLTWQQALLAPFRQLQRTHRPYAPVDRKPAQQQAHN